MFDLVVSLGGYCQPGLQARRWTGQTPFFFDSLVTPFWAAKCLIENDLDGFCDEFVATAKGQEIRCAKYGVMLPHEILRDPEGYAVLSPSKLFAIQTTMRRRWERLCTAVEGASRVLFVRMNGYGYSDSSDAYRTDDRLFGSGELWRMTTAIEKRWPGLKYHLAFAYFPELGVWGFSDPVANVSTHAFSHTSIVKTLLPELHWRGYEPDWDHLFTDLGVPRVGHAQPAQAAA